LFYFLIDLRKSPEGNCKDTKNPDNSDRLLRFFAQINTFIVMMKAD